VACWARVVHTLSPAAMPPIRLHKLSWLALLLATLILPRAASAVLDSILNPGQTGGMCMPSVTAPPCAQGDAAGLTFAEPALNLGIGNPIHLATGAKHQMDVDLPGSQTHPDLEIVRHYNSLRPADSVLGAGWQLSYDTRVTQHGDMAQIEQPNGARMTFDHHNDPDRNGTLRRQTAGWRWIWPNGRTLDFDAQGYLTRITPQANGPVTEIVRHRGVLAPAIAQVRSGAARLQFVYTLVHGSARLTAIDSPAGRFTYHLEAVPDPDAPARMVGEPGSGNTPASAFAMRLTTVTRPDDLQRLYLYEADYQSGNAALPTGIVLVQPADDRGRRAQRLRIRAWDYDAAGRAIGTSYGERMPEHGYSRIRYLRTATAVRDGVTLVKSPAGLTRFTITLRGGQPRLRAVQGAACPGCAAPGTQASHDDQGRLQSIHGTRIDRDASGRPIAIAPHAPGWPGLRMTFSASGTRRQWQSTLTGTESVQDHASTHTAVRQFANGDRMDVAYDAQGRPLRIRESRAAHPSASVRDAVTTTLQWRNGHLHCLQHPFATEWQTHDAQGRLSSRTEMRRLSASPTTADHAGVPCAAAASRATQHSGAAVWRFTERFAYDDQGRLTTHVLPEGGAVHYTWGVGEQLHAIVWEDASGQRHTVIHRVDGAAGYRYGNGLHLQAAHDDSTQMSLTLHDTTGARWRQIRQQDPQGQVLREAFHLRLSAQESSAAAAQDTGVWYALEDWRYAYDARHRLIGAQQENAGDPLWLAWQADGALAAMTRPVHHADAPNAVDAADAARTSAAFNRPAPARATTQPIIVRDPSGLPATLDAFRLTYGANRRLTAVQHQGQTLARYAHNAYGQRIRTQSGDTATDYLYLHNRLVAETAPASTGAAPRIARRYLYAHHAPVGMIIYAPDQDQNPDPDKTSGKNPGALYAIHADLLGAPRMVTDAHATLRWLATYTPLGAAHRVTGDMTLHMRLPGQWFDPATGLHDNLLRTYAPRWGQYLEPDPLGPIPGSQALGYAAQQPRRFVDPLGLLLFAFDGTRHSIRTNSNVLKFLQHYQDGPTHYHKGPGNAYTLDWDAVTAFSAPRILEAQWFNLLTALKQANTSPWMRHAQTGTIPIDVVGFSRGAALARHFGNRIVAQTRNGLFSYQHATLGLISACVDLRFIGLLDTVAQFGLDGWKNREYDLGIAEVWRWVAHAVALHDYRELFPLSSTQRSQNTRVIEAPFIGAHGDIGGGNLLDPKDTPRLGDLSDVSLNWLWWQAQAAGVAVKPLQDEDRTVRDAVVNIVRHPNPPAFLLPTDRSVLDAQGKLLHIYQSDAAHIGRTQRRAAAPLIRTKRRSNDRFAQEVDMHGYRAWLQQELGWGEQLEIP